MTTAEIITGDALKFTDHGIWPSVFTSMPDAAEVAWDIPKWRRWFRHAAEDVIMSVGGGGYAIFYQTDRRVNGVTQSKAELVMEAAADVGAQIVWHKIGIGTMGTSLFRPSYSHLICVSTDGKAGKPTPDVFMKGKRVYPNATDSTALDIGIGFLAAHNAGLVADPFCGRGSIGHAAARAGLDSVSIDILPEQTAAAALLIGSVPGIWMGYGEARE